LTGFLFSQLVVPFFVVLRKSWSIEAINSYEYTKNQPSQHQIIMSAPTSMALRSLRMGSIITGRRTFISMTPRLNLKESSSRTFPTQSPFTMQPHKVRH
jgi:hypothetical protein